METEDKQINLKIRMEIQSSMRVLLFRNIKQYEGRSLREDVKQSCA